jgi:hypothetical protein
MARLALFLAPYAVAFLVLEGLLARIGETLPVSLIATLQKRDGAFIYLARYSDHTYALKREAVRRRHPHVVALGGSRINQWRSAMFRPYSFHNAGNCVYSLKHYRRFLDELGESASPRVLLFPIDFYMFNPAYDAIFEGVSFDDVGFWPSPERAVIVKGVLAAMREDPWLLFLPARDPLYGVPALGLQAIRTGVGTRIDGSYQYGSIIRRLPNARVTVASAVDRISAGHAPFIHGDSMDPGRLGELESIARLCGQRGIVPVGLSLAFAPAVEEGLDASPHHGIWRQFQDPATAERFRQMGIIYFNFTRFASFGGDPGEMVDPFHPSEPAYVRMLLTMLEDERIRRLLPEIDAEALRRRLAGATDLEVFRNEF